jgi:hypothetical protein
MTQIRHSLLGTWWHSLEPSQQRALTARCKLLEPQLSSIFVALTQYSKGKAVMPTAEVLFAQIHGPQKPYNDGIFRKALGQCVDLVEDYILLDQLDSQKRLDLIQRWAILHYQPKLYKHYQTNLEDKNLEAAAQNTQNQYFAQSLLEKQHNQENWRNTRDYELALFCIQRMRSCCQLAVNQRKQTELEPDAILQNLFAEAQKTGADRWRRYQVWRLAYAILHEDSQENAFNQLSELLQQGPCSADTLEDRELLLIAINYCSRLYNQGDKRLLGHHLKLFRIGLERKLLFESGQINGYTLTNMVTIGLINRSYDWVSSLIEEFGPAIVPAQRTGIIAFNKARLCYALQQYNDALLLLQKAVYSDILLNLSAKTVQMKVYYALEEWSALESHLDAMSQFIRRHKELGYHRDNFNNLILYVNKRIKNPSSDRLKNLKTEILGQTSIAEKEWLLGIF